MLWLPNSGKSLMMCLAVLVEYQLVADRHKDRQTEGWTSRNSIVCTMHIVMQ